MTDIETQIQEYRDLLASKLHELEVLETEKQEILTRLENAKYQDRTKIAADMKNSEQKYRQLAQEVKSISYEIKRLKDTIAN